LKSRKRKQLRKERRRALESVDSIDWVYGGEIDDGDLRLLDLFYRQTVWAHGGFDYLRPGFFELIARAMPETMLFARARRRGETVAGALFFETEGALYGRYWGTAKELDFLHFEVAYYAGIERCIERGLELFEAGAQGEHKLLRGFEPCLTHSAHEMSQPAFDSAIRRFIELERDQIVSRMHGLSEHLPYRDDS
jgi:predicted N-acyltransferase